MASRFSTVKRKLETMRYPEPLDPLSVPLAEHLVDDLVHTTQSYANLKKQHNKTVQEFGSAADKVSRDQRHIPAHLCLARPTDIPAHAHARPPTPTLPLPLWDTSGRSPI